MATSADALARIAVSGPGIVTLLTDFGLHDPFVGVMHGVILSVQPTLKVVDLCHGIPPQDVPAARFWLSKTYGYFPRGTCHVCVVDPGVGTDRAALHLHVDGHHFIAPDNGVLTPLLELADRAGGQLEHLHPEQALPSRTFHGRDLFAPAGAQLAAQGAIACASPVALAESVRTPTPSPVAAGDCLTGRVVLADHFGNLITDIEVPAGVSVTAVRCRNMAFPWAETYGSVGSGEPVALVNSWGMVELSVNGGNAARQLNVQPGEPVTVLTTS